MSFSIEGKTAIVTGAAYGIGLAIARHFVDLGANVVFADLDEDKLISEVEALRGRDGKAQYFAGDLRQRLSIANLISTTVDAFDRVDILINASRQVVSCNPLIEEEDCFETMLEQNVLSNLRLTQRVVKRMLLQAEERDENTSVGAIVNLTSIAADRTHPDLMSYSVSCAALNQMTKSLALSLADKGIRVNAIAIGSVMSASLQAALKDNPELRQSVIDATPLGKIGDADEVGEAARYLTCDGSGFMTGQILTVDGGRSLMDPLDAACH